MGRLNRDTANQPIQGFVARRVQAVVATEAWTPGDDDRFFVATVDVNLKINGGTEFPLVAYFPVGIIDGATYTSDTPCSFLVM